MVHTYFSVQVQGWQYRNTRDRCGLCHWRVSRVAPSWSGIPFAGTGLNFPEWACFATSGRGRRDASARTASCQSVAAHKSWPGVPTGHTRGRNWPRGRRCGRPAKTVPTTLTMSLTPPMMMMIPALLASEAEVQKSLLLSIQMTNKLWLGESVIKICKKWTI